MTNNSNSKEFSYSQLGKRQSKMKSKIVIILLFVFVSAACGTCGSQKYATRRINLMMPKKSEMANNDKYKEPVKRKTNKVKVKKSKNKGFF